MYINAQEVLPEELLRKVQQYIQGKEIYIPKESKSRLGWGERNGSRRQLDERNNKIRQDYLCGKPIETLMETYYLSYDSIKRITRNARGKV